jgi:hypothetical protein
MKQVSQKQVNAFVKHALTLQCPQERSQVDSAPAPAKRNLERVLALLSPFKSLIRAGVELRMNNMQIADSLQVIDYRLSHMSTITLSQYLSTFRTHYKMPRTKGFLSQW